MATTTLDKPTSIDQNILDTFHKDGLAVIPNVLSPAECAHLRDLTDQLALGRHTDASNFLLADGHVKWINNGRVCAGYMAANSTDAYETTVAYEADGTAGRHGFTATFSLR